MYVIYAVKHFLTGLPAPAPVLALALALAVPRAPFYILRDSSPGLGYNLHTISWLLIPHTRGPRRILV